MGSGVHPGKKLALVLLALAILSGCGTVTLVVPEGRTVRLLEQDEPAAVRGERKLWFWLEGDTWRVGVALPMTIRVDEREGVTVELEGDTPYASEHAGPQRGRGKKH